MIECKKNNPDYVNWVFFRSPATSKSDGHFVNNVENVDHLPSILGWHAVSDLKLLSSPVPPLIADEARETRDNYLGYAKAAHEKTKTSNNAIQSAANQVALATQAIVAEEVDTMIKLGNQNPSPPPWLSKIYLPTIVTTASLHVCDFDPDHVDGKSGEIPIDKVKVVQSQYLPQYLSVFLEEASRTPLAQGNR